jgi:type IV pilus assembly protein PilA
LIIWKQTEAASDLAAQVQFSKPADGTKNKQEKVRDMRKQKGFSLIELLIVVAIILIIAAIAIPNLLRSRIAANEASAVGSVRTLNTAEITYASTYPDTGFTCTLTNLGPLAGGGTPTTAGANLIDSVLAGGTKSGYTLGLTGCGASGIQTSYFVTNTPVTEGQTGIRSFCSDQSGVIRYNATGSTCDTTMPPLQ